MGRSGHPLKKSPRYPTIVNAASAHTVFVNLHQAAAAAEWARLPRDATSLGDNLKIAITRRPNLDVPRRGKASDSRVWNSVVYALLSDSSCRTELPQRLHATSASEVGAVPCSNALAMECCAWLLQWSAFAITRLAVRCMANRGTEGIKRWTMLALHSAEAYSSKCCITELPCGFRTNSTVSRTSSAVKHAI